MLAIVFQIMHNLFWLYFLIMCYRLNLLFASCLCWIKAYAKFISQVALRWKVPWLFPGWRLASLASHTQTCSGSARVSRSSRHMTSRSLHLTTRVFCSYPKCFPRMQESSPSRSATHSVWQNVREALQSLVSEQNARTTVCLKTFFL